MDPILTAILIPIGLLAGCLLTAVWLKSQYRPSGEVLAQLIALDQVVKQITSLELPRLEQVAEMHLETARGMLESAEQKRKRAAGRKSQEPNLPTDADNAEPWLDPAVPAADRRRMLESIVNRGG